MGRKKKEGEIVSVQKIWLSRSEAMSYLDCSDDFLLRLRNKAEIRFARYSNTIWYDLASIERFLKRNIVV